MWSEHRSISEYIIKYKHALINIFDQAGPWCYLLYYNIIY